MVEVRASDVHLTPGFQPALRVRGRIVPMDGYPQLGPQDTREIVYSILNDSQRKKFENQQQLDFAYAIPGVARFRVNCFFQRGADALDFATALKAALREDPDVILVGEMRDLETISTALTAAETGHLVFATLHTQSTAQTVDRIIDVFPPHQQHQVRMQLSIALQGIVTQQLLPTADGSSRVCACEVMVPTPAVRNLIREGKTHQIYSALQTSGAVGMQTMDSHLAQLVRSGKINRPLAEQRASVPEELKRLLGGVGDITPIHAQPPMEGVAAR